MSRIDEIIQEFAEVVGSPKKQLAKYVAQGKKAIGVMPYYAPEEIVYAAGMVPMGMWGSNNKTISQAKEYFATFYCALVQLDFEMLIDGTMDMLSGVITPTMCDTLRPASQNIRVAMTKLEKMPAIFLAHPQNRTPDYGIQFCMDQYNHVKDEIEKIKGGPIEKEALQNAIKVYNRNRAARRRFTELANEHPDIITPTKRMYVLNASYFMLKDEHTPLIEELNEELSKLPKCDWKGTKVVISSIVCANPELLKIFETYHIAVAADDVAQWTRSFRTDAPETDDPIHDLAVQFSQVDFDPLLYDNRSSENRRAEHIVALCRESGAQGVVVFINQFCDPEEMEYPYLKKALKDADIPHVKLGIDLQMRDFGQVNTSLQAFADVLEMRK